MDEKYRHFRSAALRQWAVAALLTASLFGGGCIEDLDYCTLLSLEEVRSAYPDVINSKMELRHELANTKYCIWSNAAGDEQLLLSIGNPTRNPPYDIIKTMMEYMEGNNTVQDVVGVGVTAAALFSTDDQNNQFRMMIANGDEWSVTVRARGIKSVRSEQFEQIRRLSDLALERFDP